MNGARDRFLSPSSRQRSTMSVFFFLSGLRLSLLLVDAMLRTRPWVRAFERHVSPRTSRRPLPSLFRRNKPSSSTPPGSACLCSLSRPLAFHFLKFLLRNSDEHRSRTLIRPTSSKLRLLTCRCRRRWTPPQTKKPRTPLPWRAPRVLPTRVLPSPSPSGGSTAAPLPPSPLAKKRP